MDQKNTIVKCKAHPDCLFNHNGVCDNYVINIGADGKCECYIETELIENVIQDPVKIGLAFKEISKQLDMKKEIVGEYKTINVTCGDCEYFGNIDNCPVYKRTHVLFGQDPICLDFKAKRGQRANCDFINDGVDQEIVNEVCKPFTMSEHLCDTRCKYWQLDSYSEWVCSCMAQDFNPHGYCPHYEDGGNR